jgi:hypothetical protein
MYSLAIHWRTSSLPNEVRPSPEGQWCNGTCYNVTYKIEFANDPMRHTLLNNNPTFDLASANNQLFNVNIAQWLRRPCAKAHYTNCPLIERWINIIVNNNKSSMTSDRRRSARPPIFVINTPNKLLFLVPAKLRTNTSFLWFRVGERYFRHMQPTCRF